MSYPCAVCGLATERGTIVMYPDGDVAVPLCDAHKRRIVDGLKNTPIVDMTKPN